MTHQDYIKAIEHEQSLIRRLFTSRNRRAEAIDNITAKRYAHLIGKFFRKKNDPDTIYRIKEIFTRANYVMSDQVDVVLSCDCIGTTVTGENLQEIVGLYIHKEQFTIHPSIDIDTHLSGRFVSKEVALERFIDLTVQLKNNLGL